MITTCAVLVAEKKGYTQKGEQALRQSFWARINVLHGFLHAWLWIAGTSPAMTNNQLNQLFANRLPVKQEYPLSYSIFLGHQCAKAGVSSSEHMPTSKYLQLIGLP